jgi:hypothetical protein
MRKLSALLIFLFVLPGCRVEPVLNIHQMAYERGTIPHGKMKQATIAIIEAGSDLGWEMKSIEPGHIVGTLNIRAHIAMVDIFYNTKNFTIKYKRSYNLRYDGTNIHKGYNSWITNLRNKIQNKLVSKLEHETKL